MRPCKHGRYRTCEFEKDVERSAFMHACLCLPARARACPVPLDYFGVDEREKRARVWGLKHTKKERRGRGHLRGIRWPLDEAGVRVFMRLRGQVR